MWGHVITLGLGRCDVSLAQVDWFHIIDNCVDLGENCGGSTVGISISEVFGGPSKISC